MTLCLDNDYRFLLEVYSSSEIGVSTFITPICYSQYKMNACKTSTRRLLENIWHRDA